jgi:integrase
MRQLFTLANIRTPEGRLPRTHDLRHAFAVNALLRWYRAGIDVQAKLPRLATYMGHVSNASTEYYLPFIEDLAAAASERFAAHCGALVTPLTPSTGDHQ